MEKSLQQLAIEYHNQNMPIFPVNITLEENGKAKKLPLISGWQNVTVADFDNMDWLHANGIGMRTGKESGTTVLDLDIGSDTSGLAMPPTPCQRTGSGGTHHLYKYIEGVRNSAGKIGEHMDIRGDGGYIVLAGSWHPGGTYEWIIPFGDIPLADAPQWLVDKLGINKEFRKHDPSLAFGAPEGTRNQSAASVIGHIIAHIHPNYWLDFGLGGLREWNKRNTPPLPDEELVSVFKSIASKHYARK